MRRIFALFLVSLLLIGCSTGKGIAVHETGPEFPEELGKIYVYFCPQEQCEENLISFLDSAQESIHCALFDIGLPSVQEKLLEKEKKIEVKIVTDNDYLKKFNHDFVKADTYGLMHNYLI